MAVGEKESVSELGTIGEVGSNENGWSEGSLKGEKFSLQHFTQIGLS